MEKELENETEKFWNILSDKVIQLAGGESTTFPLEIKKMINDMLKKLVPSRNLSEEKLIDKSLDEMKLLNS